MMSASGWMEHLDLLQAGQTLRDEQLTMFGHDHFGAEILGLRLDELSLQHVRAHVDCGPRHHQPYGIVHGGVWCAIVESLASLGAAANAAAQDDLVVGVSNTTDFLRAHRTGRVDALAEPIHVGRTQQLWQVVLTRAEDGKAVARGQVRAQSVAAGQPLAGQGASVTSRSPEQGGAR
jgi:1,4-dihydroxy-2-naphthoyl-CoA hydrolase